MLALLNFDCPSCIVGEDEFEPETELTEEADDEADDEDQTEETSEIEDDDEGDERLYDDELLWAIFVVELDSLGKTLPLAFVELLIVVGEQLTLAC